MESADELLHEVEVALHSLVSRIDSYDDAILAMESVLQKLIVLQPLLSVDFQALPE